MIIEKLDPMLCLAFGLSDGPFPVEIMFGEEREFAELSKWEIANISKWEQCTSISIVDVKTDRRWRERTTPDRRSRPRSEEDNLRAMLLAHLPEHANLTTDQLAEAFLGKAFQTYWDSVAKA